MASTINTNPGLQHLRDSISWLGDAGQHKNALSSVRLEVFSDLGKCQIIIDAEDNGKVVLLEKSLSELDTNQNYFEEIVEKAKQGKALIEKFKQFCVSNAKQAASSNSIYVKYSLNPAHGRDGSEYQLQGAIEHNRRTYRVNFGSPIKTNALGENFLEATMSARAWTCDMTRSNLDEKLRNPNCNVRVIQDGNAGSQVVDDDPVSEVASRHFSVADSAFDPPKVLEKIIPSSSSESLSAASSSTSSGPITWEKIKGKVEKNFNQAVIELKAIKSMARKNHPYKDISIDQLFAVMEMNLVPKVLGNENSGYLGVKGWSCKVSYNGCDWFIPVIHSNNELMSKQDFLERLQGIAYFGPELINLLLTWGERGIILSTNFEESNNGLEYTIGLNMVGNYECCSLTTLRSIDKGEYKERVQLPDKIYDITPKEFCNTILEPRMWYFFSKALMPPVFDMMQVLHKPDLHREFLSKNAKLWWAICDQRTMKLVVDVPHDSSIKEIIEGLSHKERLLQDKNLHPEEVCKIIDEVESMRTLLENQTKQEQQKIKDLYRIFLGLLRSTDSDQMWEYSFGRESYNSIREWRNPSPKPDPVAPMAITIAFDPDPKPIFKQIVDAVKTIQYECSESGAISYFRERGGFGASAPSLKILYDRYDESVDDKNAVEAIQNILTSAAENPEGGFLEVDYIQRDSQGRFVATATLHEFDGGNSYSSMQTRQNWSASSRSRPPQKKEVNIPDQDPMSGEEFDALFDVRLAAGMPDDDLPSDENAE